jgi:beta-aspartyl-peptidase (threonine type)
MKAKISLAFILAFALFFYNMSSKDAQAQQRSGKYTIVIHGGAGTISESIPDSVKDAYLSSLRHALEIGKEVLDSGGTSLEAVEKVIRYFEDDPKFNAGIGAVYTSAGTHELDAAIMDGRDLSCGAVAGVEHIAHPISLAKLVMEKTPHVLLAYGGAEEFAKKMGVPLVPNSYFDTPARKREWEQYLNKIRKNVHGTVGCVALDQYGNLAAGTSTGGMTGKMPGRIGDSPLIGDGTYANNQTCAISGTGWGEKFIKNAVAFNISALMAYKGLSLTQAVHEVIHEILKPGDGGVIAVDRNGDYAMDFNTSGMFRGVATSSGVFEVKIWK